MRNPRLLVVYGSRDGDDELVAQVERAATRLRPRPEVVGVATLAAVDDAVQAEGPFDLIVAGSIAGSPEGLKELRRLRVQLPQTGLVLAFDSWRSASLRDTIRAGAVDILRLPVSDEALAEAIDQALEVRWAVPLGAAADPRRPVPPDEGAVIAVVSATGGCGKTFFATNLAYHLHAKYQKRACLIDLDLQFGELSTALRLKARTTITDVVAGGAAEAEDLPERLEEALLVHNSGIRLLAAPNEPAEADGIDVGDVGRIIQAARARHDHVIIDTPAALSEAVLVAIEHADQVYAIATLDLPSVRNLGVLLATFKQLKVPTEHVHLVLNKVEPDVGIDIPKVTKYFPQGFSIVVPYGREVNRSLNMGTPMLAYAPRSDVGKALVAGLDESLHFEDGPEADGNDRPGRRSGLLRRRSRPRRQAGAA